MPVLTPEQLAQIRAVIQDASTALAVTTTGYDVSDTEVQRLVDAGWVNPKVVDDIVAGSFTFGKHLARGAEIAANMSLKQFAAQKPLPLTVTERHAVGIARQRAGIFCTNLGHRYSDEVGRYVVQADAHLAEQTREVIRDEVARKLVERRTRKQLASDMRSLTQDWGRDWGRIAATESQMAMQEGFLEGVIGEYGDDELLAKVPEPEACEDCQRLYLENGAPKIRPASWWQGQGGNNVGRKRQDWLPVLGAMHPWCQCQLVRVPRGMVFEGAFPSWSLVPEETEKSRVTALDGLGKSYKLHDRITFQGFKIAIENRKGSVRHWYDKHTDTKGQTKMRYPYGYFNLTEGMDGDHVDCFVGPDESAGKVYIVHQLKAPHFKTPDEDKVMIGFGSAAAAKRAYLQHFDQPGFFGSMTAMGLEEFRTKVYKMRRRMIKARRAAERAEAQLEMFKGPASDPNTTPGYAGGYQARVTAPVGGMGQSQRDAPRTPGQNLANLAPVQDWPPFRDPEDEEELDELAAKRKQRRRAAKEKRESMENLQGVGPGAGAKPMEFTEMDDPETAPRRAGEVQRETLDRQQQARYDQRASTRLTLNPKHMRR
jgi:hypothetical protein